MGKLQEASENIKRLSAMFKGLVEASDEIDKMGSLEGHVAELELSKVQLLKGNEDLIKQNSRMMELIESHKMDIELMMVKAKAECGEILHAAKVDADLIKSECLMKEKEHQEAAMESDKKFELQKANHEEMIKALESAIEEKSKKLEEINAALDKIKGGI